MPTENAFIISSGMEIPLIPRPHCDYCSYPIPDEYGLLGHCKYCTKRLKERSEENYENRPYSFIEAVASSIYLTHSNDHGVIGNMLSEFKSTGQNRGIIAEVIIDTIESHIPHDMIDLLVPVPSGSGIDIFPTKLLADEISKHFSKPVLDVVKFKEGYIPSKGLPQEEKFDNAKDMVFVKDQNSIIGKSILLIDDLITTCGTVHWTSHELMKNGAKLVFVVVVCRSVDRIHLDFIGFSGRI